MKRGTLIALMVMALAGGLALAQTAPTPATPMPPTKTHAPMARGGQGMRGMMAQAIPDLTSDQLDKMDALRTAQIKVMEPMRTDLQIKGIELRALWRADEPDANKILAKVKEISDLRQKMEIARVSHLLDIWKLLTPDQRKAVKKMGLGRGMFGGGMGQGRRGMMRGWMGGQGRGMMGENQSDDPPGPMMGQGGQQGCSCGNMH